MTVCGRSVELKPSRRFNRTGNHRGWNKGGKSATPEYEVKYRRSTGSTRGVQGVQEEYRKSTGSIGRVQEEYREYRRSTGNTGSTGNAESTGGVQGVPGVQEEYALLESRFYPPWDGTMDAERDINEVLKIR